MNITIPKLITTLKSYDYAVFEGDTKNFNINIVGIRTNDNKANSFNDLMILFWKYGGHWNSMTFPITTDPGIYWRENPMNIKGTAVLKTGQYRGMWSIGKHQGRYDALRQVKPCTVYRDNNKDNKIDTDGETDTGLFGINHHKAGKSSTQVDKWSAGCQVQPNQALFDIEMKIFKQAAENWGNSFTYTLLDEDDIKWSIA
jgi:hypothetical protein